MDAPLCATACAPQANAAVARKDALVKELKERLEAAKKQVGRPHAVLYRLSLCMRVCVCACVWEMASRLLWPSLPQKSPGEEVTMQHMRSNVCLCVYVCSVTA